MDATQRLLLLKFQKIQEEIANLYGKEGPQGSAGKTGLAATLSIGDVTAVPYGTPPTVTNVGTTHAAILDFELETGPQGADGEGSAIYWQILLGESVTVTARTQYPVFAHLDLAGSLTLEAGAELIVHS